jgi:cell wall-associated NlpC family hydrolase
VAFGKGLDCSGLSFWTYNKAAGANKLIDASNPIYEEGASGQWTDNEKLEQISKGDLKRGDLLFLIEGGGAKHVIMYVGNGYVVHAEGVIFNEIKKEELSTVEARYTNYGYTIGYGRVKAASGDKFNIGDIVRVTTNLNVRPEPGSSLEITDPDYPGYAPAGTIGIVLSGPSSADSFIWWEVDYGPGLYSGWSVEGGLEKVDDNILPTVDAFSVTPASVTLGDAFTIPYTVSDTGGSGLKQVELWRKGTGDWEQIGDPISLVGEGDGPYSNSFYDAPISVGTYEYGMHVVDNEGNWGWEPDPPGPIEVEVTPVNQPPTLSSGYEMHQQRNTFM